MRYGQLVSDSRRKVWVFHRVVQVVSIKCMLSLIWSTTPTVFLFVLNDYIYFLCRKKKKIARFARFEILRFRFKSRLSVRNSAHEVFSDIMQNMPFNDLEYLGFFISPPYHPLEIGAVGTSGHCMIRPPVGKMLSVPTWSVYLFWLSKGSFLR
ncbi:hypothetical protein HOLleu_16227 [Holothuria leucospilota]|uniref:Uncharacterized protein n=1 Tax=Holothuria leucospilota TaxID=206669 RepID=A0A9Q1C5V8_HOLLE|nr:hypothetical protein HOLleu_16227 [Holothuria leucospilota]